MFKAPGWAVVQRAYSSNVFYTFFFSVCMGVWLRVGAGVSFFFSGGMCKLAVAEVMNLGIFVDLFFAEALMSAFERLSMWLP